ncbi:MAG: L,D-transpeptidase family protein [Candidatus Hydrogenedentes bacterium]|nr:L,D-transpeptidase family protein [Candidatus Hydrogenedentota bacterium]
MNHATAASLGAVLQERRRHGRAATRRSAVYARMDRPGVLIRAVVENVSLTGVCLRSRVREQTGASIEIEIGGANGAKGVILVRGRVAYVNAMSGGAYAVGVRLIVPARALQAGDTPPIMHPDHARAMIASIEDALLRQPAGGPFPVAVVEHLRCRADIPDAAPAQPRRRRKRALALLLCLALLLAFLGYRLRDGARNTATMAAWKPDASDNAAEVPPEASAGSNVASDWQPPAGEPPESAQHAHAFTETGAFTPLPGAHVPPFDSEPADSAGSGVFAALAVPPERPGLPVEAFVSRYAEAYELAAAGNAAAAAGLLADMLAAPQTVDPVWREKAGALRDTLSAGGSPDALPPPMRDAFAIEAIRGVAPFQPALSIAVSKRDHTLAVFRDGVPVARFPVGLGQDGSTPSGRFYIANKIAHPDWYNRGEVVKAGDPANPLGAYWMGLGDAGGATSYGIHPTAETASVGQDASRGCIRMFPDDAAKLFRICDVGAPVLIE